METLYIPDIPAQMDDMIYVKPVGNQVLLKPLPSAEISESGFFVPLNARKPSNRCTVVKVGRGTAKRPMKLKVGMIAYRVRDWGEPILINDELHFLMDDTAILATE